MDCALIQETKYTWKYLDAIGISKWQTQTVNWGEQLENLPWKNNESDYLWKHENMSKVLSPCECSED